MDVLRKITLVLISGMCLSLSGIAQQYNVCEEALGDWTWADGTKYELTMQGYLEREEAIYGSWKCNPEDGAVKITLNNGSMYWCTLSADGSILYAANTSRETLFARRDAPAKEEGPSDLMDKSKEGDGLETGGQAGVPDLNSMDADDDKKKKKKKN